MTAFLTTLWAIIKWATIIGGSIALVVLCIVIFHPIYFSLYGRASVKGQRGEVRLTYLFNIIKIRYIASAHTQDVWLEFFKWRKLLQRETRIKPSESTKTYEMSSTVADDDFIENEEPVAEYKEEINDIEQLIKENDKQEVDVEAESTIKIEEPETEKISEEKETTSVPKEVSEEPLLSEENKADSEVKDDKVCLENIEKETEDSSNTEDVLNSESEDVSADYSEPEYRVEATPEQLAQLQSILEAEEKKEESKAKKDDWQAKLRKLKKDFNRRYNELSGKFRLIRQKWNSLWPVVKRFWNRGKKGFRFHDASLKIKYSLDEHYLTGMMYGYIAPTIGFAKQYGLDWQPVAVFPEKPGAGVYSKMAWHIDIRIYMLLWAIICLFFEKNIYKELYWFYKYKKEKKAKNRAK